MRRTTDEVNSSLGWWTSSVEKSSLRTSSIEKASEEKEPPEEKDEESGSSQIKKGMPRSWALFPYGAGGVLRRGDQIALRMPQQTSVRKLCSARQSCSAINVSEASPTASSTDPPAKRRPSCFVRSRIGITQINPKRRCLSSK